MKITDIKTFIVGNPWKNWVFIKVETGSIGVELNEWERRDQGKRGDG